MFGDTLLDKLLTVDVSHWVHVFDDGVHERLSVGWLIKLIVTHLTISDKINHDIFAEFLTILGSDAERVSNIVHGLGIHMENRCTDCSGDLRTVSARSGAVGSSCKADLVVDYNVDGATDGVVFEGLHLEALVDNTLTGDSGISVHNNRNNLLAIFVLSSEEVLLSAGTTTHTRVDSLQMRWVGHQSELNFMTRFSVASSESCAQMILNITCLGIDGFGTRLRRDALELSHDNLHGLANNISQSVETTSMSHSNYESASTLFHGRVDAELETGNKGFTTLKAKTLHRVEFASHESTPLMGPVKARVHVDSLFLAWLSELDLLKLVSDPIANLAVFNVHELDTNLVTVCLAVSRN